MNTNGKIVKIITQTGAVGIALAALWGFWSITTNHLNHNTEVLTRVEETLSAQVIATISLTDVIRELNYIIK